MPVGDQQPVGDGANDVVEMALAGHQAFSRLGKIVGHAVEGVGEGADFVVAADDRPRRQFPPAETLRRVAQLRQGPGQPAGEADARRQGQGDARHRRGDRGPDSVMDDVVNLILGLDQLPFFVFERLFDGDVELAFPFLQAVKGVQKLLAPGAGMDDVHQRQGRTLQPASLGTHLGEKGLLFGKEGVYHLFVAQQGFDKSETGPGQFFSRGVEGGRGFGAGEHDQTEVRRRRRDVHPRPAQVIQDIADGQEVVAHEFEFAVNGFGDPNADGADKAGENRHEDVTEDQDAAQAHGALVVN